MKKKKKDSIKNNTQILFVCSMNEKLEYTKSTKAYLFLNIFFYSNKPANYQYSDDLLYGNGNIPQQKITSNKNQKYPDIFYHF